MYGKNTIQKQIKDDGRKFYVQEMFYTVQGEGISAGTPAVFIRLAGCNLACTFCDTEFEDYSRYWSIALIRSKVFELCHAYHTLIVITGGEPFRQNIVPLVQGLCLHGYLVEIETAGTLWPHGDYGEKLQRLIDTRQVRITVSPKTPKIHSHISKAATAWKYIIKAGEVSVGDGLPNMSTQVQGKVGLLARPDWKHGKKAIFVQPCDEPDPEKSKANLKQCVDVALQHGYRISVQLHKILGLP